MSDLIELKKYHYANKGLVVSKIQRREIAFAYQGDEGIKGRAKYFETTKELSKHLQSKPTIEAVYASTAYYLDPQMYSPGKRGHLGYDLVFDIDLNPSTFDNRIDWMYEVCYTTSMLVDVLVNELDFKRETMSLDFSGGKGFHITIEDESLRDLTKEQRADLVDYIIGTKVVRSQLAKGKGGWNKKYTQYVKDITSLVALTGEPMGLPKATAKKISDLMKSAANRNTVSQGHFGLFDEKVTKSLQSAFYNSEIKKFSAIDKPVTTDKHRILRVPGSIHAKTGLVSTRLKVSTIDEPESIFEQIKLAAGTDEVEITLEKDTLEDFTEKKWWLAGTHKVPRWLALHLLHQ